MLLYKRKTSQQFAGVYLKPNPLATLSSLAQTLAISNVE
jgi:hypothetical protein